MRISFSKMHGNGNDFVLLSNMDGRLSLTPEAVRRIASRRFGVGCDQLLVAEPPAREGAPVAMRIYNTDGTSAGHCGNGLRSFAVFVREQGLVSADRFSVELPHGVARVKMLPANQVHTCMGVPRWLPSEIPLNLNANGHFYSVDVDGERFRFAALSMGNPHAVLDVDDVERAPVERVGPLLQGLSVFPEGVNVGFRQQLSRSHIRLRVFERGVGETLACGSGACAAVVSGIAAGSLDTRVQVDLPGGALEVYWPSEGSEVELTGPAAHVFDGEIEL